MHYLSLFFVALLSTNSLASTGMDQYIAAEKLYLSGNTAGALQGLNALISGNEIKDEPKTKIKCFNLRGLIYFQNKNLGASSFDFESAVNLALLSLGSDDPLLHLTKYNLGNVLYQTKKEKESMDALSSVNPKLLDQETRVRFYHLRGNIFQTKGMIPEAVAAFVMATANSRDPTNQETFAQKVYPNLKLLFAKNPKGDLEYLDQNISAEEGSLAWGLKEILESRAFSFLGAADDAKKKLESVLLRLPKDSSVSQKANELLHNQTILSNTSPDVIGVLLPLSGKFAKFGRLCLNSILLAAGQLEEMPPNSFFPDVRIAVRDSGDDPDQALLGFDELVKKEGAIVVVGPLLSKQNSSVAQKAQEYGVPLFSLSQRIDSSQTGNFVFPIALSPQEQVENILIQAMAIYGFHRFAIMAPQDSLGSEYATLFWDEVERRGGEITGYETYPAKSTDFQEEVKSLLGMDYLSARYLEQEDLKRREGEYASTLTAKGKLRQRMLEEYKLKGVVDFDAIFVPDDPTAVGQIAPALAVENVSDIPFLGLNTWNTPEIVQRAGRYLQRSVFVDSFFASSKSKEASKFVQDYDTFFHSTPGTIEAQSYDAALLALQIIGKFQPRSRLEFRESLYKAQSLKGISGNYFFSPESFKRDAHLLTVRGNQIVELSQPLK